MYRAIRIAQDEWMNPSLGLDNSNNPPLRDPLNDPTIPYLISMVGLERVVFILFLLIIFIIIILIDIMSTHISLS